MPVNDTKPDGTSTVKHWEQTQDLLEEKLKGKGIFYAVTLHQGKNLCDEGDDSELKNFIKFLIGKYN